MGQPSRMRTICRRARRTSRAGCATAASAAFSARRRRGVRGGRAAGTSGPDRRRNRRRRARLGWRRGRRTGTEQPGVLEPADVVFDMGVGSHVGVEDHRVAGGVGVVTPVAEQKRREQAGLGAGMQWFAAHDQPGPCRPAGQVDQVGDLRHRRAVADLAVLADRRRPASIGDPGGHDGA